MKINTIRCGIIVLFLTVGCCGCLEEEKSDPDNLIKENFVSFEELDENIEKYVGENISIEGYIKKTMEDTYNLSYVTSFCNSNVSNPDYCVLLIIPNDMTIYKNKYMISGVVSQHPETFIPMINVISAELSIEESGI